MTLKEKIMKLQTYKMFTGEDTVYVERDDVLKLLEQERNVGRWIFVEGTKGKDNVEKCSRCGSHWREAIIYRMDTQEYLRTRLLYCPNCGSRNEVEE